MMVSVQMDFCNIWNTQRRLVFRCLKSRSCHEVVRMLPRRTHCIKIIKDITIILYCWDLNYDVCVKPIISKQSFHRSRELEGENLVVVVVVGRRGT